MRAVTLQLPSDPHRASRRRTGALVLTLLVHLLLLVMLTRLAPSPVRPPEHRSQPLTVDLLPAEKPAQKAARKAVRAKRQSAAAAPKAPAPPAPATAAAREDAPPLPIIQLSKAEFAAADISKMPSHHGDAPLGGEGGTEAGAHMAGDSEAAGVGPGGQQLYNAEWYRRPTDAELSYYLPKQVSRPGWAMIACKTASGYRVEDCIELGQSPPASGLSSAMRQAAWQFRVRPPRIGGRPVIGAWVRIRIDFTESAMK